MKKKEMIILGILGGVALIGLLVIQGLQWLRQQENQANQHKYIVRIYVDSNVVQEFDPNVNAIFTIQGNYGEMEVEVKDGAWHVSHVECPNHICEKMGWKTVDDIDTIVCIPNGINIIAGINGN